MRVCQVLYSAFILVLLSSCSIYENNKSYDKEKNGYAVIGNWDGVYTKSDYSLYDKELSQSLNIQSQLLLEKEITKKLTFNFKYHENIDSSCELSKFSNLLERFFDFNDSFGSFLVYPHVVDIVFIDKYSFHMMKKVVKQDNVYKSSFFVPTVSCRTHELISEHFYLYFYLLLHEIYHVDDIHNPNIEKSIFNLELSATKKSHCDFFMNSKFKSMSIHNKVASDKELKNSSEYIRGYSSFFNELYEKVGVLEIKKGQRSHKETVKSCLES